MAESRRRARGGATVCAERHETRAPGLPADRAAGLWGCRGPVLPLRVRARKERQAVAAGGASPGGVRVGPQAVAEPPPASRTGGPGSAYEEGAKRRGRE